MTWDKKTEEEAFEIFARDLRAAPKDVQNFVFRSLVKRLELIVPDFDEQEDAVQSFIAKLLLGGHRVPRAGVPARRWLLKGAYRSLIDLLRQRHCVERKSKPKNETGTETANGRRRDVLPRRNVGVRETLLPNEEIEKLSDENCRRDDPGQVGLEMKRRSHSLREPSHCLPF
jgi:DNA-directed RNA polymerase specialized sigma24 family protein